MIIFSVTIGAAWPSTIPKEKNKPQVFQAFILKDVSALLVSYPALPTTTTTTMTTMTTTTTTTTTLPPAPPVTYPPTTLPYVPPTTTLPPAVQPSSSSTGSDGSNAFTASWYRCVINPESGGNFNDTSGGYGILVSTWGSYGMSGVPGQYSPGVQASVALRIFAANGGFGPGAWNNSAGCGKGG